MSFVRLELSQAASCRSQAGSWCNRAVQQNDHCKGWRPNPPLKRPQINVAEDDGTSFPAYIAISTWSTLRRSVETVSSLLFSAQHKYNKSKPRKDRIHSIRDGLVDTAWAPLGNGAHGRALICTTSPPIVASCAPHHCWHASSAIADALWRQCGSITHGNAGLFSLPSEGRLDLTILRKEGRQARLLNT
jgi:hypothetical protein